MTYEVKAPETAHSLILENRARLSVTGVQDVDSFDETLVVMYTAGGTLVVRGSQLKLEKLNLEVGEMAVSGGIDSLVYEKSASGGSFLSRLFS